MFKKSVHYTGLRRDEKKKQVNVAYIFVEWWLFSGFELSLTDFYLFFAIVGTWLWAFHFGDIC